MSVGLGRTKPMLNYDLPMLNYDVPMLYYTEVNLATFGR